MPAWRATCILNEMADTVTLSIIIASHNTRELLRQCLTSILQFRSRLDLEIIVIDNASSDGSVRMMCTDFPQVRLIQNHDNVGFAKAVNQGLKLANGLYLLLLNSDTEIKPNALQHSIAFLEAHPKAGIVGCKLLNPDGSLQPSCESFPRWQDFLYESLLLDKLFPRNRVFGRMHLTYFGYDRAVEVGYVKGAFLLVRRAVYDAIGGLDEAFYFYGEEMDWCYRAKKAGWLVYFTPAAQIVHYGGQSSDPMSPRMFVLLHQSRFRFYSKYHGRLGQASARLVLAFGALLRSGIWCVAAWLPVLRPRVTGLDLQKRRRASWAAFRWYVLGQEP